MLHYNELYGIPEFPKYGVIPPPDLIGGSHHKESRILYRDPWVKPEDDIAGKSRFSFFWFYSQKAFLFIFTSNTKKFSYNSKQF